MNNASSSNSLVVSSIARAPRLAWRLAVSSDRSAKRSTVGAAASRRRSSARRRANSSSSAKGFAR
jgi:hypothetical protein